MNRFHLPRHIPGLLGTDKMDHADRALEMLVGGDILVVRTGCAIHSPYNQLLGRWWAVYDRHYRPVVTVNVSTIPMDSH
jgi:hypothetical protein